MKLNLIVATDLNNGIGYEGRIPWDAPADLAYFRSLTIGGNVIMGRKTHDSIVEILGKTLPGRRHIVVSRTPESCDGKNSITVENPFAALTHISRGGEAWVIGGGEIYKELLPICDYVYMTKIHEKHRCDTFFPDLDLNRWKQISNQRRIIDYWNPKICFRVYENRIISKNRDNWS